MARGTTKEYLISVKAHKSSLDKLRKDLEATFNGAMDRMNADDGIQELTRKEKAAMKSMLGEMLELMGSGSKWITDATNGVFKASNKSIDEMRKNVKEAMEFASGFMEKMRQVGDTTDWMQQGVGFVDQFIKAQEEITKASQAVDGLERSLAKLNKNFSGFKDALAVTDAEAYLKRFGRATKVEAENVAKAQKAIKTARNSSLKELREAAAKYDSSEYDQEFIFADYDDEGIKNAYGEAIDTIVEGNKKIEELKKKYKKNYNELHKDKEYKETISSMSYALRTLDNLPEISGDAIGASLKMSMDEAVKSVRDASNEIKQLVANLQGEGIELSVVLPDPNAAEFAKRIESFIEKLDNDFKKNPIKISVDVTNPFDDTKGTKLTKKRREMAQRAKDEFKKNADDAGFDVGPDFLLPDDQKESVENVDAVIFARKLVDSFNQVYKAMKPSQQLILNETQKWRKEMNEALSLNEWAKETKKELKLHVKYDEGEAKTKLGALLAELQNYLDSDLPDLYVGIDVDRIISEIDEALRTHQFEISNIHASNIMADNISGGRVSGGARSGIPVQHIIGANRPLNNGQNDDGDGGSGPTPPPAINSNTGAVTHNTDAISESTQSQNGLTDAVNSLKNAIAHQSKVAEEASNKHEEAKQHNKDAEARIAAIDKRLNEINEDPERKAQIEARQAATKAKRKAEEMDISSVSAERFRLVNKLAEEGNYAELDKYKQKAIELLQGTSVFADALKEFDTKHPDLQELDSVEKMNGWIKDLESRISSIQKGENVAWLEKELAGLSDEEKEQRKTNLIDGFKAEINAIQQKMKVLDDISSIDSVLKDGNIVDIIKKAIYVDAKEQEVKNAQIIKDAAEILRKPIKHNAELKNLEVERDELRKSIIDEGKTSRDKTNKKAPLNVNKRRLEAIENIVDNNLNPVKLVYDSVEKFLSDSNKNITDAKKSKAEYEKQLEKLDTKSPDYKKRKSELDAQIKKEQDAIARWTDRQSLMKSYGFLTQTDDGALQVNSIDNLTTLLQNVSTLSDSLSKQDSLNLAHIKDLAYYIPIVQETLGVIAQTNDAYVDEKSLEQQFLAVIAFNKFKEKLHKLTKGEGDLKPEDLESFISFFENIKPMAESVELAKKYLELVNKTGADELTNDDAKTYADRAQKLWDDLGSDSKKLFVDTLRNDENYKNITSHEQFNLPGEFDKLIHAFDNNIFESVQSNPQLNKLISLLERASVLKQARTSAYSAYDYAVAEGRSRDSRSDIWSALNMAGTPSQPISVRIVDSKGNEKVYSLHSKGQVPEESDREFKINPKALNKFYRIAGISDKIEELVAKMFDPETTSEMFNKIIEDFIKTSGIELALGKNAFTPKKAQKYLFPETAVGKSQSDAAINQQRQLQEQISNIENGIYPQYLVNELSKLANEDDKKAKIVEVIGSLKARLAKLQNPEFTKEEIVEAVLALIHDQEVDKAKEQSERKAKRQNQRKAKRLSGEELSQTYQARKDSEKSRIYSETRIPNGGEDPLSGLLQRIDVAKQYGLMDTSYLEQLAENYKTKLKEAQDVTTAKHAGKASKADMDIAWNAWREARKNLVDVFFDTDGWYLSTYMTDEVNRINNEAKRTTEDKKREAAMADESTKAQYDAIEARKRNRMSVVEANNASYIERFITAPKRDVELELKNKNNQILEEQKKFNEKINALYNEANNIESVKEVQHRRDNDQDLIRLKQKRAELSKDEVAYTEEYRKALEEVNKIENKEERGKARRELEGRFSYDTKYSSEYREGIKSINADIDAINARYGAKIQDKKRQWIEAEAKKLQSEFDVLINSLLGISDDIIPKEFAGDIKNFSDSARKSIVETMTFFNEFGQIGEIIAGSENGIDGKAIREAAEKAKEQNAAVALHSHPDGMKALTPQDIISAAILANDYGVGVSGSIADNVITAVDFSGISKTTAEVIASKYKQMIAESEEAILFDLNTFELTAEAASTLNDNAKAGLSYRLNEMLRQVIAQVVGTDAGVFKQVDVANASQLANIRMKTDMLAGQRSVSAFNAYVAESGMDQSNAVTSIPGIHEWISRTKQSAENQINLEFKQALSEVDISNVIPQDVVQSIVNDIMEQASQQIQEALVKVKSKTDKQLLAEEYDSAGKTHEAKLAEILAAISNRDAQIEEMKRKYGISDEDLGIHSSKSGTKPSITMTTTSGSQPGGSQPSDYTGGSDDKQYYDGFATEMAVALDTSGLAKESTLRGIYSLLNGGPPEGGWGDSKPSSSNYDELRLYNPRKDLSNSTFASSVADLIRGASNLNVEVASLVSDGKVVARATSNSPDYVNGGDIARAMSGIASGIDYILHNHPDAEHRLSIGDIMSAYGLAYHSDKYEGLNTVKGMGSYNEQGVSLLSFDDIPEEIAYNVLKQTFDQIDSELAEKYKVEIKDDNLMPLDDTYNNMSADALNNIEQEIWDYAYKRLEELLVSNFDKAGYEGAYQSFTFDEIAKLAAPEGNAAQMQQAAQNVADAIAQAGSQAAVEASREQLNIKKQKLESALRELEETGNYTGEFAPNGKYTTHNIIAAHKAKEDPRYHELESKYRRARSQNKKDDYLQQMRAIEDEYMAIEVENQRAYLQRELASVESSLAALDKTPTPQSDAVVQNATQTVAENIVQTGAEAAVSASAQAEAGKSNWQKILDIVNDPNIDFTDREVAKQVKQYSFRDVAMANGFLQREGYINGTSGKPGYQNRIDAPMRFKTMDETASTHPTMIQTMADIVRDIEKAYQQLNPEKYNELADAIRQYFTKDQDIKSRKNVSKEEYTQRDALLERVFELAGRPIDVTEQYAHTKAARYLHETAVSRAGVLAPIGESGIPETFYNTIDDYITGFFASFNLDHIAKFDDVMKLVESGFGTTPIQMPVEPEPTQTAGQAMQETVPEKPVEVPVEPVVTKAPNLENVNTETTKELAKYIDSIQEKGDHGFALKQGLYKIANLDLMSDDYKFDASHSEKLAKIWGQLESGINGAIAEKLKTATDGASEVYLAALQQKLSEIAQQNNLDYKAINESVAERNKLNKHPYLKGTKLTPDNIDDAKNILGSDSGLFDVYDMLSVDKKKLNKTELKTLGNGYFNLLKTINSDLYATLDEDIQALLQDAAKSAREALKNNNVEFIGEDELVGKTITDETSGLISGRKKKTGKIMTEMTLPALVQTNTDKDGKEVKTVFQKAQGTLLTEKQIADAKQEQINANNTLRQQESQLANTAQERANAEQNISNSKDSQDSSDIDNTATGSSGSGSDGFGGGGQSIKGGIHGLAQESTLRAIAALITKGIKVDYDAESTDGGGKKSGGKAGESENEEPAYKDSNSARARLEAEIAANYSKFRQVSDLRETNKAYSIDIINPRNIKEIEQAEAALKSMEAAGKKGTQDWIDQQQILNNLLAEQEMVSEKITLTLDKQTGEINYKTGFKNIAAGTKAAEKELQLFESLQSSIRNAGALGFTDDNKLISGNAKINEYLKLAQELDEAKSKISTENLFNPAVQKNLYDMSQGVLTLRKEVEGLLKFTGSGDWQIFGDHTLDTKDMSETDIEKRMRDMITANTDLQVNFEKMTPITDKLGNKYWALSYSVQTSSNEVQAMTARINPLTNALEVQAGALQHVDTGWEKFVKGLKGKFSSIIQYLVSITSIHDFIRYIRTGVQYVRDIDLALTELKKVTNATNQEYNQFLQTMSKTANVVGGTVSELTNSAADWARLGWALCHAPLYSNI